MTSSQSTKPETPLGNDSKLGSYTALRLEHASAEHIHLTTRRCFIGPIPEGWLKSHRKSWYSRYLLSDYSSRAVTFSAKPGISHQRQITGLDGPSASATFSRSFPQPEDFDAEPDDEDANSNEDRHQAAEYEEARDGMSRLEAQSTAAETGHGSPEVHSPIEEPHTPMKRQPTFKDRLDPNRSEVKPSTSSFVTAPTWPQRAFMSTIPSLSPFKSPPTASFVTAKEDQTPRKTTGEVTKVEVNEPTKSFDSTQPQPGSSPDTPGSVAFPRSSYGDRINQATNPNSTDALIPHGPFGTPDDISPIIGAKDSSQSHGAGRELGQQATAGGMVRFNLANQAERKDSLTGFDSRKLDPRKAWKRLRKDQSRPGEIVKMEKMLVRVDSTMQELPLDYDENDSLKTSARTVEKWREFVVVCRESTTDDAEFSIQLYKTRVIPSKEETHVQKHSTHEIPLARKTTHVNLYSSLDKTVVIWVPWKAGTMIYILRTHSAASAVEWYTFIRRSLGEPRVTSLQVNVPDLSVTLQLDNPFSELEASISAAQANKVDEAAMNKTMEAEKAAASIIIQRSLKMLENNPEWSNVLEAWLAKEKIGLAWKRYDRLEWVHGANEQKMYGTLAMQRTHELELRPKDHYLTSIKPKGEEAMNEPAPVEGFLVRLTSQKGSVRRLGKMYFKRLYFTTHNQFLCYCRPAKALPPPPPKLSLSGNAKVPSADEIVQNTPLIYAVNPYPTKHGEIEWLHQGTAAIKKRHDEDACKEAERNTNTMLQAEGYINLSHVVRVQNAQRGNSVADENVGQGQDVDFHEEVEDTRHDDGKTDHFDDNRTFELVMKNKLVIRLQAYNETTKKEWINRLRKLLRALNLKQLDVDEESEAYIGQFGSKWEVTRSVASPKLFNMCGVSCCRAITMAGILYRKPKRHATFQRCGLILCHGQLLVFHGTLRERTGKEVRHIQHEKQAAIDLKNCYIYSGLVTEGDLLYQNQTFDSNHPGHHALPRVYLEDGWTSTDEDTMTTFVIWQPQSRSLFKANEQQESGKTRQRLRLVAIQLIALDPDMAEGDVFLRGGVRRFGDDDVAFECYDALDGEPFGNGDMDGPVTLMMQNTLLVKKDQAGNQDAKKKRMLKVVRASARKRGVIVRDGLPAEEQAHDAAKLPWHGGTPVNEPMVRGFVHKVFALKVHLGIRYEEELDECEATVEANGEEEEEEEKESGELKLDDIDDDEDFAHGYQCLGVEEKGWNEDYTDYNIIKDVIITSSLRTYSWGPGDVILGTRLQCETDSKMMEMTSRRWRCFWCQFETNVPVKLLHGPWNEDQLSFLQVLIEGGAYLDPENNTHKEVASSRLTEAVKKDDYRAIDLLSTGAMESQYSQYDEKNYFEPSFRKARFIMDAWDDSRDWIRGSMKRRTLGLKPNTEHLKLAVIERGCRRHIVKRLLWAESSDIDRADPAVMDWVGKKKEQGDRTGQWLLNQLTKSGDKDREEKEIIEQYKELSSSYDFKVSARGSSDGIGSDDQNGDGDDNSLQYDSERNFSSPSVSHARSPSGQADISTDEEESENDTQ
ncbi:MAG: hypothetical protein ASARMPREDX12_002744 [Alectoria sarmentosa]|nr:MAG: hypothetical protein ASARMPREDX12_002744 [Alectoria sarmentosa]